MTRLSVSEHFQNGESHSGYHARRRGTVNHTQVIMHVAEQVSQKQPRRDNILNIFRIGHDNG